MISKLFEKLVNNKLVDHLEWPFPDFKYGFRSNQSTADLVTIVSDRTARAYIRSGTTQAVALNISKVLDRVWQAGLLHKLKSQNFRLAFGLISSLFIIEGFKWFWVGSFCKNIQFMLEFLKAPFLFLHLSL